MASLALLIALTAPLLQAVIAALIRRPAGLRDVLVIVLAISQLAAAISLIVVAGQGQTAQLVLAEPLPGMRLAFAADPLGMLFGALVSTLGALNALYAIGYVRAARLDDPGRMQALIAFAIAATMGVAYAANLLTFFIASEALSIAAFLLIAHGGTPQARKAALAALSALLTASFAFLLPAIVWTTAVSGGMDFKPGGLLAGRVDDLTANLLFLLFMLGLAKTAMMPFHAMATGAAATAAPAAATLTAICAISAGGFAAVRIALNVFGPTLGQAHIAATIVAAIACVSIVLGAVMAMLRSDLRERVAYLAVSQSAVVVLAVCLATPTGLGGSSSGWFASVLQIGANALGQLTLTLSLGAVALATERTRDDEMDGLGRVMPWVMVAFACGAASLIGAPPLSGAWAKLWMFATAAEDGALWAMAVLGIATVCVFAALAPLTARALSEPAPREPFSRTDGTPVLSLFTVVVAALSTASLVFVVDPLARYLAPLWGGAP